MRDDNSQQQFEQDQQQEMEAVAKNIFQKLNAARLQLQSTKIAKTGWNDFSKYHYFKLDDVLPKMQEIFAQEGLCGVVSFTRELATLTINDTDSIGHSITITSPFGSAALKAAHEVQQIGAVETYQRRYLWFTAFEVVEHDEIEAAPPVQEEDRRGYLATKVINEHSAKISGAMTHDELVTAFTVAYKLAKQYNDPDSLAKFTSLKDTRKEALSEYVPE